MIQIRVFIYCAYFKINKRPNHAYFEKYELFLKHTILLSLRCIVLSVDCLPEPLVVTPNLIQHKTTIYKIFFIKVDLAQSLFLAQMWLFLAQLWLFLAQMYFVVYLENTRILRVLRIIRVF